MLKRNQYLSGLKRSPIPIRAILLFSASLQILAGCALTPDASRPDTISAIERLEGYVSAPASTQALESEKWWQAFGSPEIDSLVTELRADSLTLKETRLQVQQARELVVQAHSFRLPSVNGSADISGTGSSPTNSSFNFNDAYGLGLTADYSADIFGGLRSTERATLLRAKATELTFLAFEQQEIALLIRNWIAASSLKRQLELAEETSESFRTTYELTDKRYRAGSTEVSAGDVQIARQNYDSALVDIPDLQTQLTVQLFEIDEQLAQIPGHIAANFVGAAALDRDLKLPIGAPMELLANRPDVAAAELSYRAGLEDVGAARADLYPALTLSSSLSFQGNNPDNVFSADGFIATLVGSLTQPIFNGDRLRSEVRLQNAEAEELATAFARTALGALIDVEQAAAQLKGLNEQLARLDDNVASAELSDKITQNRYRRGLGTLLSVLESQRTLNTARRSLILAEQSYLNAYVDLFMSLGGTWFDPETDPSLNLLVKGG